MLNFKAELLLDYICSYCDNGYKIVTVKEMLGVFPNYLKVDQEELNILIKTLVNRDYISNKYSDLEQYCLYCLPKGKSYLEDKKNKKYTDNALKTQVAKLVFFSSLIGAFLGTGITMLIFLVVKLC